jgi:hypothetical protein
MFLLPLMVGLQQTQYPSLDGSSSKGPLVGNHSGFQSGSSASALGSLQTSSWVREQPRYHKLVQTDRSARNPSREVPGLVPKKLKSGGKSTPWASGSTSTSMSPFFHVVLGGERSRHQRAMN